MFDLNGNDDSCDSYEMGAREAMSSRVEERTCPICGDDMTDECGNCGWHPGAEG